MGDDEYTEHLEWENCAPYKDKGLWTKSCVVIDVSDKWGVTTGRKIVCFISLDKGKWF